MKKIIKRIFRSCFERIRESFLISRMKKNEIRKFKDKRRKKIFSEVVLSLEQKKMIDSFYKKNYGKKIPYTWHRYYTAYTGKFDVNYFPELLYIPEFEYFMNLRRNHATILSDKNILQYLASSAQVAMPHMLFSSIDGLIKDSYYNALSKGDFLKKISNLGECFFKPTVDSCSGQGCRLLNIKNGIDKKTEQEIVDIFSNDKRDWVVQERQNCHETIRKIYPNSVNTFRVITYRWKNDFRCLPAIMRIGRGGANVDNAHAGGIFIAINDDGCLHKMAFTEFKEVFLKHPDTGIVFDGYKIDNFPRVLISAKKCHAMLPQFGCVNWDFTINENGSPVLIEANVRAGSIWLVEIAHGKGAFGEDTAEILKWLRVIKKAKYSERSRYMFGQLLE